MRQTNLSRRATCFARRPTAANIVKDAVLKVYPGAPHGLAVTHGPRFLRSFTLLNSACSVSGPLVAA